LHKQAINVHTSAKVLDEIFRVKVESCFSPALRQPSHWRLKLGRNSKSLIAKFMAQAQPNQVSVAELSDVGWPPWSRQAPKVSMCQPTRW
jgi:hypothetical protein